MNEFNRVEEEQISRLYEIEKAKRASQQISEQRMEELKSEATRRLDMDEHECHLYDKLKRKYGQR